MRTSLDCFPCFLKQALYTAQLASAEPAVQERAVLAAVAQMARFDFSLSPPENAEAFYRLLAEMSGCPDPFAGLKEQSTAAALALRDEAATRIRNAADPLAAALRFAMAGNIIDYGAHHDLDQQQLIDRCLAMQPAIDDYQSLRQDLERAERVLLLADNCGELVFDGLLLELLGKGKEITVAVKGAPIINDATMSDARQSKLPASCRVIDNGTACPGTPLGRCSEELEECFKSADLIISKGQGNFETLSDTRAPLYFLLTVKCEVVAAQLVARSGGCRVKLGDLALVRG